jgi:hypothetical protein
MAISWLLSFQNHPHYYSKNPAPKSSDICHLPRRWAVLSIPPSRQPRQNLEQPARHFPASVGGIVPHGLSRVNDVGPPFYDFRFLVPALQVWAALSRITYGNVRTACPDGFRGPRANNVGCVLQGGFEFELKTSIIHCIYRCIYRWAAIYYRNIYFVHKIYYLVY